MFLEMNEFYARVATFVGGGYQAAQAQITEAAAPRSKRPPATLRSTTRSRCAAGRWRTRLPVGYDQVSGFAEGEQIPSQVLAQADPAILADAQPMVDMARAAEGRLQVPLLEDYEEDFSQYKPRSYYAGNPLLEVLFPGDDVAGPDHLPRQE